MKRKIIWSLVGFVAVLGLVLASCGPTTPTAPPTTGPPATAAPTTAAPTGAEMVRNTAGKLVEKPQYGGTLRYRVLAYQARHFDPLYWDANNMLSIVMDRSMTAPWEKGPSGTNELALDYSYYPQQWYEGELLESYEVIDIYTVRYKVRPGIHYWNKAPVNGRELTADDAIWNYIHQVTNPKSQTWHRVDQAAALTAWTNSFNDLENGIITKAQLETYLAGLKNEFKPLMDAQFPGLFERLKGEWPKVYDLLKEKGYDVADRPLFTTYVSKIDKYTFEFHTLSPSVTNWQIMPSTWMIPHEVVDTYGTFDDWSKVVGTGPWIPKDYVSDMSTIFDRNPNYWQYDPLLPDYRLPYADRLDVLVIQDDSTYYAALRTGKIDLGGVVWSKVESFKKDCPQMLYKKGQLTWTHLIHVRNDVPPFNDVRVRQAVMLGVDQPGMANDFYKGNALIYTWPEQPAYTDGRTPPEELPADIRELYEYHPDKAKQLLTEAGYPNGFKDKLIVYPSQDDQEACLVFKEYMAKIGIQLDIEVPEAATYSSMLYGRQYQHMISCWWGNNFPADALNWCEGGVVASPYNFSNVVDPTAVEVSRLMSRTVDENERYNKILKEDNLRRMKLCYNIVLPTPVGTTFWWPWLKNYNGEQDLGWPDETGWGEIPKYLWIDRDLKYKITGAR
jgi:ABC-type transport system substrate-binding protein